MTQLGFFDIQNRYREISKEGDFLERLNEIIDWEMFRNEIDKILNRSQKSRPAFDSILMFKIMILQSLYNLSDEQSQFQILDRLSFTRFLGLRIGSKVPDARTIWLFREHLKKAKIVDVLFAKFSEHLERAGLEAKGGQIIDASFVQVPRQRNSKDENKLIKDEKRAPDNWKDKKKAHKDIDAAWTKKNDETYFGYKNHINVDNKHKLIRNFAVTDASAHDSQKANDILDAKNEKDLWADSAYRSDTQEQSLKVKGYTSHIHERGYRGNPLTEEQKKVNTEKSRIRARVEHIFGHMHTVMNGTFIRTIGKARAYVKVGLKNLAYNMSRFLFLSQHRCA